MKGFVSPMVIMGVGLVLLGAAAAIQTKRVENIKAEYAAFVSNVKLLGEQAEKKAREEEAQNRKRKEASDRENAINRSRIADLSRQLREQRSRTGILPGASPGSASPQTACFSRPELERALQSLDAGVSTLLAEGDAAIVDLNSVKSWATAISQ